MFRQILPQRIFPIHKHKHTVKLYFNFRMGNTTCCNFLINIPMAAYIKCKMVKHSIGVCQKWFFFLLAINYIFGSFKKFFSGMSMQIISDLVDRIRS